MKNVNFLLLSDNKLCSLPSDIAHMETLATIYVRLSKRLDHDLTTAMLLLSGRRQPARVSSARARSADQSQDARCAALEADGSCSDAASRAFRLAPTSSRLFRPSSVCWPILRRSTCGTRQMHLDLTHVSCQGRRQPAHVAASGNRPADTSGGALSAKFESSGLDLTQVCQDSQQSAQMAAGRAGPSAESQAPLCATLGFVSSGS
jgi:hypothetical protein